MAYAVRLATLPALGAVISATLPATVELLPGFTVERLCALLTEAGARGLADNLAVLEDHPCAAQLGVVIEQDWSTAHAAVAELTAAQAAGWPVGDDQLVETVRGFHALAENWIELAAALAASGPVDAGAALERFLDQRGDKPTDARRHTT